MLILSRKVGESLVIGEQVTVTVVRVAGDTVRIGIEAPEGQAILRRELWAKTRDSEYQSNEER